MSRAVFGGWLLVTATLLVLQSVGHLLATGPFGTIDSLVDLDRSNGIPDVLSTIVIAIAAAGAAATAHRRRGWERLNAVLLAVCVCVVAVDDVVGLDRDVTAFVTLTLTGLAILAAAALAAAGGGVRAAITLLAGLAALAATLFVGELPDLEQWFERARGDTIIELQIVAKQGLELGGWALVALGAWDRAWPVRRRV